MAMTDAPDSVASEPVVGPATGGGRSHHRVAIIGAGFGGLGSAIALRRAGIDDLVILERADDVGGVWRDNAYPGIQCDVPSHLYCFSFEPKPDWSRSFGVGDEIRQYLEHCADRYGLRGSIRFGTTVADARWDDVAQRWELDTDRGAITADIVVAAIGGLSEPAIPELPGIESFEGTAFHSAGWRHDHDLTGERVAVIGTGASAIQFVPEIQPRVGHLDVYPRTPPWVVPRLDRPIPVRTQERYRRHPWLQRAARSSIYWGRELLVLGFTKYPSLLRRGEDGARKLLEAQVEDPELRAKLTPSYSLGCKRVLLSNDWYPALTQPNVDVVTDGIAEVRPHSIVTTDGTERPIDTIIYGTGFKATTHPAHEHLHGRDGRSLAECWGDGGMAAYKGTTVAGFPNLFLITGPNTGLGHSSMVFMMESQFSYLVDAVRTMDGLGIGTIEPRPDVQAAHNEHLQERLARTVWNTGGCASWYLDAEGRNPTLWPGFTWQYRLALRRFDAGAYVLGARRPAPTVTA